MFVGITRFSLFCPKSSAWYLSKNATDENAIVEYKKKLFDSKRLDERISIFYNISLPSLKLMKKNYEYIHVLQISDMLPDFYKNMIYGWCKDYPFLKIQEFNESGKSDLTLFEIIKNNTNLQSREKMIGVFNLDDDDLLANDFFDKSKKYLTQSFKNHCLSFGYGITALMQDNNIIEYRESYKPKINIGLMRIGYVNENELFLPKSGNHALLDKYSPTIVDSREVMYIWVRHFNQDSSNSINNRKKQLRIILNNFKDFNEIKITDNILDKFPLVNFGSDGFSHKEEVVILKDLSSKFMYPIELKVKNSGWIYFEIYFEIINEAKIIDPLKVALISFKFDKDLDVIPGLSKSKNPKIGFFKYVSFDKNDSKFNFSLSLPDGVNIDSVSITRWRYTSTLRLNKILVYKFK